MIRRTGFLKLVILTVVALIVLGYFGFDIQAILHKPFVERNLTYAKEKAILLWDRVLEPPVMYIWNRILKPSIE